MKMFGRGVLVLLTVVALAACSGSGGGGGIVPAGGTANSISSKGGAGVASSDSTPSTITGGSGGYVGIWPYDGNKVVIKKTGSVDTSFDTSFADQLVASSALAFGSVPLEVTSDLTIKTYLSGDHSAVSNGEYHLHVDSNVLSYWNGSTDESVTGIHVHPGVTLTFALNWNWNYYFSWLSYDGLDAVGIWGLSNDIWNQGTITTLDLEAGANEVGSSARTADATSLDKGSINLQCSGVWLNEGTITTKGDSIASSATSTNGGQGGYIYAWSDMLMINKGTIVASGGNGANGGGAGYVQLQSMYGTWNAGPVTTIGGIGYSGEGGMGGNIELYTQEFTSTVYNAAALDASGGNGTGGGGNAGSVNFSTDNGDIINSGRLKMNGGSATEDGNGGQGANAVNFVALGGSIRNSGAIEMAGGSGKGVSRSGGAGGSLYVFTDTSSDPYNGYTIPAGSIKFSGSILADAGAGESGGDNSGSWIQFYHNNAPVTGDIELVGYGSIDVSGGSGRDDGGSGGGVEMWGDYGQQSAVATFLNEADILAVGGEGRTGSGGTGGYAYIDAYYEGDGNPADLFMVDNSGAITTSGGKGATSGGNAGQLYLYASQGIRNSGNLDAVGGAATSPSAGAGGQGYYIDVWALSHIKNSGVIDSTGGSGALTGGNAGGSELWSEYGAVQNSGNMIANGGNADVNLGGSTGGNAANIDLYSSNSGGPYKTTNTGILQANGGTGQLSSGSDGNINIWP